MPIPRGYSVFSGGPIFDITPKDADLSTMCGTGMITDAGIQNTLYGPPYGVTDSAFTTLKNKLAKKSEVTNPAGLAAKIGREKIGQAEMTRRSVEAQEK